MSDASTHSSAEVIDRDLSTSNDIKAEARHGASPPEKLEFPATPLLKLIGRPQSRQFNVKTFTLLSSTCLLIHTIMFSVQVSTVTSVQKAFGLTTLNIGAWFSAFTVGEVVSGILVTYFAGRTRTPQIVAVGMLVTAAASLAHAAPHFFLDTRGNTVEQEQPLQKFKEFYLAEACGGRSFNDSATGKGGPEPAGQLSHSECSTGSSTTNAVLIIYVAAGLVMGIGYPPVSILPMVYIDDNASSETEASFYQGLFYGVNYFGFVIGYVIAAGTLSVHVDLRDVGFAADDPRWIGAWWLGYVICGAANVLLAGPMFLFPRRLLKVTSTVSSAQLPASEEKPVTTAAAADSDDQRPIQAINDSVEDDTEEDYSDELPSPKLFLPTLWSFVKNPIYMLTAFTMCALSWIEAGFHSYLPKYLEVMYHQTAAAADLETGVGLCSVSTVTVLFGGWVISRFKLNVKQCIAMIICTNVLGCALYLVGGFLSCPQHLADSAFTFNSSYDCSNQEYSPMCVDGKSFYSPCHAGCQNVTSDKDGNIMFHGCFCSQNSSVEATAGLCVDECSSVIPYLVIIMLAYALPCFSALAGLTVLMRCVKKEQKGFSLGIYYEFLSMIAFLPSPLVYGKVIDGTCLVWGREAEGCVDEEAEGSCVLYDNSDLRIKLHALATSMQGLGFLLAACTWFAVHFLEPKRQAHPLHCVLALEEVGSATLGDKMLNDGAATLQSPCSLEESTPARDNGAFVPAPEDDYTAL